MVTVQSAIHNTRIRKTLQEIADKCGAFHTWAPRGARFLVSLPMDEIVLNHEIEVDVMCIDGYLMLHILKEGQDTMSPNSWPIKLLSTLGT